MSRPESLNDLSDNLKESSPDIEIDFREVLALSTDILHKLLELVDALEIDNNITVNGERRKGDPVHYHRRLSSKELGEVLESKRRDWDLHKKLYEQCLEDPSSVERWEKWGIDDWARREGKPAIDWPEEDA